MQTQWGPWLAAERRAQRGGEIWPDAIVRGLPFAMVLPIPIDVSGDAFVASLRIAPGAVGDSLADFACTPGSYEDGFTLVTFTLTAEQTALAGAADADGDGLAEVVMDALYTPAGGLQMRAFGLVIPISDPVTEPAP
ncbi:hypothetical protein [Alteraurantiacibacter palmitatis]|uniref:Uncharacterized protein n=1 Tax=Alteraurantiacibacter palmitatis TaxID=2054628 RepID=A0ABV7E3S7_9SPHN